MRTRCWRFLGGLALCASAVPVSASAVREWNEVALAEVRAGKLGPPVAARALAVAHTCMYDAWTAYDRRALGAVVGASLRRPVLEHTAANKTKAISYAAYRCLLNLYPAGQARLDAAMLARGYNPADTSTSSSTPQGVGNRAAAAVIASRRNDGSNQYGDLAPGAYADYTGYAALNAPLPFCDPLTLGRCLPDIANPTSWQPLVADTGSVQRFIAPHWRNVRPFALSAANQFDAITPAPNYLRSTAAFLADVDDIIGYSARLTEAQKLIVEYWADGPASELPPGHWALFAQSVSLRDGHGIDEDVRMFFALHNASFDAGIVAWYLKRKYDGVRPITAARYFKQGQQIRAWGGPGRPVELIPGEKWTPYNPGSNLSPAFPGYISGHSTFSAASAEVLRSFTGSDSFGYATIIPPDFGRVEPGVPTVPTLKTYGTFTEAADEAGESRLYGGIHFADDNTVGQMLGTLVGRQAFAKARFLYDGGLAVDTVSNTQGDKAETLVWNHTVPDRSNRLLLVGVAWRDGNQAALGVSYGGQALVRLGSQNAPGNQNRVEVWYGVAPNVGTAPVTVRLAKGRDVIAGAISFTGVHQTTPFATLAGTAGQSKSACVSLTGSSALAAYFVGANGDADAILPPAAQAVAWNQLTGTAGGDIQGSGTTQGGASGSVCQALERSKPWAMVGVSLNPALAP